MQLRFTKKRGGILLGFGVVILLAAFIGILLTLDSNSDTRSDAGNDDIVKNYKKPYGTGIDCGNLANNPTYKTIVQNDYTVIATANGLFFSDLLPTEGSSYQFACADRIINFAVAEGIKIRGHNLIWHGNQPDWLKNKNFARAELETFTRTHIETVAGRYRGKIYAWDVLNEAFDGGTYRNNIWYQKMGEGYIKQLFVWAKAADPSAKLYYNDYGMDENNEKASLVRSKLIAINDQYEDEVGGKLIDGVGFQMHLKKSDPIDLASFRANIRAFYSAGFTVHITELDIREYKESQPTTWTEQATSYNAIAKVCIEEPGCEMMLTWGVGSKDSWINYVFSDFTNPDSPLTYDINYVAKPAKEAILSEFRSTQCVPSCSGKECGNDGCGGTCGTCDLDMSCSTTGLCIPQEPTGCPPNCPIGDLNKDGKVTLADYSLFVADYLAYRDSGSFNIRSDLNSDTKITIGDYTLFVNAYLAARDSVI